MTKLLRTHIRTAALGAVSVGVAVTLSAPAPASALPAMPDLSSLSNSSAGLPSVLEILPGLLQQAPLPRPDGRTHCTKVVQIGDSTSVSADSATALPRADDTATAQYGRVGVSSVAVDALSGRAIVGGPGVDAEHAVTSRSASAGNACWVIAMGVNDAGAISGGSSVGADERIDRIMKQLTGRAVLWPTIASSNPSNPAFGRASMKAFNDALRRATTRYPNLAVYDWAATARPEMFTDGIHYTSAAYADRNRRFADALAAAYPTGGGASPTRAWIAG
ncbi:SGNH/GDSL hydrolase family protein [Gordonia sp. PDNC005]|uniref:SGNH/GDSL hydrolase family protein n=1 Tax=unclassified Gordonia (in: high G+C Gram-positive bacteria) TaxID=2657482 RepID=UPI001963DE77|nr:SGNH/GDSL hydrolase family protein [Gordonia sp. PDNC005]QRY62134.1 SGNH/GDSL hydrolase family protein [Gordonia sp. PDNC005]